VPQAATNILTRLKAEMAADKRKAALLVGLCVLAAVVIGRNVGFRSGPQASAAAEPPAPAVAAVAVAPAAAPAVVAPRLSEESDPQPDLSQVPQALDGNPFEIAWGHFQPIPGTPEADAINQPVVTPIQRCAAAFRQAFADRLAAEAARIRREAARRVRIEQARRARIEAIRRQARALKLRSTMTGAEPMAVIDGSLVRLEDTVAGFVVRRIEPKRVLVCKGSQALWIEMD